MTATDVKTLSQYSLISNGGGDAGRRPRIYLYVACFLIFLLSFHIIFLVCTTFNKTAQEDEFDESYTNVARGQRRANLYSLFTALLNENPSIYDRYHFNEESNSQPDKVLSCYYNAPSNFSDSTQLLPEAIHPHLCTHINVAFGKVINKTIWMSETVKTAITKVVELKKVNPDLKVLLSIGGGNEADGFTDMVVDHASRKLFIKSIKAFLTEYKVDGIDLDWEFPSIDVSDYIQVHPRERQHFSQLLREIRVEYQREKRDYLLTVAAAAPQVIVDTSYDVDQLNLYTDYVNIMTYDFHYYARMTPFTGLNSPLYPRRNETAYLATLNINSTVNMYVNKGLSPNKIVVGVPTYGHTFTLVNANNPNIGSPASGYGQLGSLGFVNFPDICMFMQTHGTEVTIQTDPDAKVPYLYSGHEWITYENKESVMDKATFVKNYGLRGAMIYSLNADDFKGHCQLEGDEMKFPLSQSIRSTLVNSIQEESVIN